MNKLKELWTKFMEIHYLAPFGNGGRGTKVFLWPFVGVAVVAVLAPVVDHLFFL